MYIYNQINSDRILNENLHLNSNYTCNLKYFLGLEIQSFNLNKTWLTTLKIRFVLIMTIYFVTFWNLCLIGEQYEPHVFCILQPFSVEEDRRSRVSKRSRSPEVKEETKEQDRRKKRKTEGEGKWLIKVCRLLLATYIMLHYLLLLMFCKKEKNYLKPI